jgi:hypothetical protein
MFRITKSTVAIALMFVWLFSEPTVARSAKHEVCASQAAHVTR